MTTALQILRDLFTRNEDIRSPDKTLREEQGTKYKKGYEIRLTVYSEEELQKIKKLLRMYQVKHGKPFSKARRFIIPIYGKDAVDRFLLMINKKEYREKLTI